MIPDRNKKIYFISLGCDKNRVDAEQLCYKLEEAGYTITGELDEAQIALINTCGFIAAAKEEGIEAIFDMVREKESGNIEKIVVTGCLSERHGEEMKELIPEIDAIVGIGQNGKIVEIMDRTIAGEEHIFERCPLSLPLDGERLISTPIHYAYLKIAEGCDNHCTYCAIPGIRGRYRSRKREEILREAEKLVSYGVREIILVAQDTTSYGKDLYDDYGLSELLEELCKIGRLWKIRVLYAYPEKITDKLVEVIREQDKIAHYLDIPLQHADPAVLKRMGRAGSYDDNLALIRKLRSVIPDMTIRSTFIAGFPGETEEMFQTLLDFVREADLDRSGCFAYSEEEGTAAARMKEQIPEEIKQERAKRFYDLQTEVTRRRQMEKVGKTFTVINDGFSEEENAFRCRGEMDAPEEDCAVFVPAKYDLVPGELYRVNITGCSGLDLTGELETD